MAKRREEEFHQETLIHRAALRDAFRETMMVKDKSYLQLSSGGIGLLITLLTTTGVNSIMQAIFYGCAFVAFTIAIIIVQTVLELNGEYLKFLYKASLLGSVSENEPQFQNIEKRLRKYDKWERRCFICGIAFFAISSIFSAGRQLQSGDTPMSQDDKMEEGSNKKRFTGSFDGFAEFDPGQAMIKVRVLGISDADMNSALRPTFDTNKGQETLIKKAEEKDGKE